jgi:hypothetical protein
VKEAPKTATPAAATTIPSSLVVIGRLILLLLAAGAVVCAAFLGREDERAGASSDARWVCPMHPEVTASTAGECPICGMALRLDVASTRGLSPSAAAARSRQYGLVDVARRRIFSREVRAPAWLRRDGAVEALVYNDDLATLAAGERGAFHAAAAPDPGVGVRLATTAPAPWDGSTSVVHFHFDARAPPFRPGAAGWVALPAKAREVLVVPAAAVLQSSDGPYVLAAAAEGSTFTKRPVRIGKVLFSLAVVVSGLREGERIAVKSAFFLDAEQRLRAGSESSARVMP